MANYEGWQVLHLIVSVCALQKCSTKNHSVSYNCVFQVCKRIWLGLYDDRTSSIPDFREPQKVKEFLQEKYEKKRW